MIRVVLHSGGLDSTVCLLRAAELGPGTISVGIDYRQRHSVELAYAAEQCERFGIPRKVLQVTWDKPDRTIPEGRSVEEMRAGSPAFLPGRNAVFLTLGCAQAATLGASEVWIGVNSIDFSGYPDCTSQFIDAFNQMIGVAIPHGPRVVAPLLTLSKQEIATEAARLGLAAADTWSCYRPIEIDGKKTPCNKCDACVLHTLAWSTILDGD